MKVLTQQPCVLDPKANPATMEVYSILPKKAEGNIQPLNFTESNGETVSVTLGARWLTIFCLGYGRCTLSLINTITPATFFSLHFDVDGFFCVTVDPEGEEWDEFDIVVEIREGNGFFVNYQESLAQDTSYSVPSVSSTVIIDPSSIKALWNAKIANQNQTDNQKFIGDIQTCKAIRDMGPNPIP